MKTTLAILLPAVILAGCSTTYTSTPTYDTHFGVAVTNAKQAMTLNPAPAPVDVQGIDGRAAHEAIVRYHESFKTPPPVVNVINLGGGVSGSGNQ